MANILDNNRQPLEPQKFYLIDNKICKYLGIVGEEYMFSDILAEAPILKSSQELINTKPILSQPVILDNHEQPLNTQNLYSIKPSDKQYQYLGLDGDEYMFRDISKTKAVIIISFNYLLKNPPVLKKVGIGGKSLKKQKNKTNKRKKTRKRNKSRRTKRH